MKDSKASAKRVRGADNRKRALELRKSGATYRQIGESIGISMQRAHQLVVDELECLAQLRLRNADELRLLELERLDMASIPTLAKLKKGCMRAANVWIKLSESRRKLLGVDAPVKIAPTNPVGDKAYQPMDLSRYTESQLARLAEVLQETEGETA